MGKAREEMAGFRSQLYAILNVVDSSRGHCSALTRRKLTNRRSAGFFSASRYLPGTTHVTRAWRRICRRRCEKNGCSAIPWSERGNMDSTCSRNLTPSATDEKGNYRLFPQCTAACRQGSATRVSPLETTTSLLKDSDATLSV